MIELNDLCKNYPAAGSHFQALRHVSLSVRSGEVLGIIGQSGAGKSTLLRCMNLLERPDSGSVYFGGENLLQLDPPALRAARRRMSLIFQHFNLLDSATVAENVALPLRWAGQQAAAAERVAQLLAWMNLDAHAHKYPAQLSGGQKQRVAIARALSCKPDVMLCDEATSALDPVSTQNTLQLLKRINQELGLTLVLISHEMAVVRALCTHVAVMEDGAVVENGPVDNVFVRPQHALTARMLEQSAVTCLRCEQRCGCDA